MIEVYKYTHHLYSVNQDLLPRDTDRITRGHYLKLKKRYTKTATRQHFFSNRVVDTWNCLPSEVVSSPSLNSFKNRLDKLWLAHQYSADIVFPLPHNKSRNVTSSESEPETDRLTGSSA